MYYFLCSIDTDLDLRAWMLTAGFLAGKEVKDIVCKH